MYEVQQFKHLFLFYRPSQENALLFVRKLPKQFSPLKKMLVQIKYGTQIKKQYSDCISN